MHAQISKHLVGQIGQRLLKIFPQVATFIKILLYFGS